MSKLRYQTLRENVAKVIREKILNKELKPGMRIIEQNLSDELEVSRGPIREALRQLEQEGVVEYTRNVGCSVKEITIKDLYEIYLLRSTYEILAVKLCGGQFEQEDIERMEEVLENMKDLKNYEEVVMCDNVLHSIFVEKGDFQRIKKVWSDLDYGSIVSCYITGFDEQKTVERQYEFHKKLVEACKTRDVDIICEELRNHYMNSVRYFMEAEGLPEDSFNVEGHFFRKIAGMENQKLYKIIGKTLTQR